MADDYIRIQDAVDVFNRAVQDVGILDADDIKTVFRMLSPADVVQVTHSRWIKTADGAECEKCGREAVYQIVNDHWEYEPFCPHCGAKMDRKREEKAD